MKKLFKSIAAVVLTATCLLISPPTKSQGPCYAQGGFIDVGGTAYFVCPMGGAYEPCAYPCRRQQ
jgi:hypothetical protein